MAKIKALPGKDVIGGFRGVLDFYVWCGIPCVRSWPRSPGQQRAPLVEQQWPIFGFSGTYWNHLPLEIKEAYNQMAAGVPTTGREIFTKSFISGNTTRISGA
ncbi:unnamed protein product [marine sediment metagenome]|uniref:Uncharacterized protein n=1 Tax=marine sediment metagenome TaxID=412755 RepID=X1NZE8_9ZZZZ